MSQPPEYPGTPADPQGGDQGTPGYRPPPPPPGYGTPPPPPGYGQPPGYGAPPGYGTPPPPPGYGAPPGYGTPPPPPGYGPPGAPPAGYPPQPGFGGPPKPVFSVGDAISWSWNKFTQNAVALAVPLVIYGLAMAAVIGIPLGIAFATSATTTSTVTDYGYDVSYEATSSQFSAIGWIVTIIGYIAVFLVAIYMQAGLATGCLDIADGKPVSIGTFFKPRNLGMVLVTGLVVIVLTAIGSMACVIPGLIFLFLAQFAVLAAVDRSLSPIDSIKASIATVRSELGNSALSWLVQYAAVLVGEIACFVGMVVGIPVASLIQTYTYRKLSGGQVVELAQPMPPAGIPPGPPPGPQFT